MFKLIALFLIFDVAISTGFHINTDEILGESNILDKRQAAEVPVTVKQTPTKGPQPPKGPYPEEDVTPRPRKTPQGLRRVYTDEEEDTHRSRKVPVDSEVERSSYSIGSSIANFWGGMFGWWRSAADVGLRNMESFVDGMMGRRRGQKGAADGGQGSGNKGFMGGIMDMFGGKK